MEFRFGIPAQVHFGAGVSQQLGQLLAQQGWRRALVVYDPGVKAAGIVDRLLASLHAAQIGVSEFGAVLPNPPDTQIEVAAELARQASPDVVVAIGGGSAIDAAKAINILLGNPSPINAYEGFDRVAGAVLPLIAIPTTAGTGSEVTNVSVVTDTVRTKKMVIAGRNVGPTLALVDPELTIGLPPAITAATGMDALTHAIEAFVSRAAMPPSDVMALEAIRLLTASLPRAYADGSDLEARTAVLLGSLLAGFAFNSAVLGLVHSIAHPLSAHFHLAHGVANAIGLPHVMAFNAPAVAGKFRRIAEAMQIGVAGLTDEQAAELAIARVSTLNAQLGIPRLRECAVDRADFARLAADALLEASTPFNPREASLTDIVAILERAF